jgi:hypothetical protein
MGGCGQVKKRPSRGSRWSSGQVVKWSRSLAGRWPFSWAHTCIKSSLYTVEVWDTQVGVGSADSSYNTDGSRWEFEDMLFSGRSCKHL